LTDTLVIDITHIDYVKVSADKKTAAVGAGIRFGPLYTALGKENVTWTGGICPTVGLSGFLSAGGFNMQMRLLGLGVDNVVSAKVVKVDGKTVTASSTENSDLFWAIRGGGGGSYGVVVEWTLKMHTFPRSAMVLIQWSDRAVRYDVANRFFQWAPREDPAFTSQVNVFKDRVEVLGWCYGCSQEKLKAMVDASGLLSIGTPKTFLSAGCNTNNARMFGYILNECVPDEVVAQYAPFAFNHIQQAFTKLDGYPQFTYNEYPQAPEQPLAQPWDRFYRLSKSFFVQKSKPMTEPTLRDIIARIDTMDDASQVWGEWHAWNISAKGDASFAWREEAYVHMEFIVHGSADETVQKKYIDWYAGLENALRPAVG
jgi:FAD/FMN-containing dehydrogenase